MFNSYCGWLGGMVVSGECWWAIQQFFLKNFYLGVSNSRCKLTQNLRQWPSASYACFKQSALKLFESLCGIGCLTVSNHSCFWNGIVAQSA